MANRQHDNGSSVNGLADSISRIAIHFPQNQSRLLKDFSNNAEALDELDYLLNKKHLSYDIDSLVIYGYASPEGSIANNLFLSTERAGAVKAYIIRKFPQMRNKIFTHSQLVDWRAIREIVDENRWMPYREEAKQVLGLPDLTDIQRFRILKSIGGGAVLTFLTKNYADPLRRASGIMVYGQPRTPVSPPETVTVKDVKCDTVYYEHISASIDTLYVTDTVRIDNYERIKKPLFALKTNLLFDLGTALNVEIEFPIGERWSVLGEYTFPWWLWKSKQYCFQLISANVEGRYWFGNRTDRPVLTGWFAGVYVGGGYYDLEWGNRGYQGEFYIAGGVSAGYVHTLNKKGNFRMEYSLGVGYLHTGYREYKPVFGIDNEWHLVRQRSGNFTWIGPTRAKISLVWLLTYRSYKVKDVTK
jgi:hypothetical protein